MKKLLPKLLFVASFVSALHAGPMPQDTWSHYGKKLAVPDALQKKGIAISGDAIYVGTTTAIQKYSLAGTYLFTFPASFTDVTGMACDSVGNLYVFDIGQSSLRAYNPSGTLLWSKGSAGSGQEQFSTASAASLNSLLAIDGDDKLYVADRGNFRVQILNKLGNFQSMWGSQGTTGGLLNTLLGIAVRNDQVIILDNTGGLIQRAQTFSKAGVFENSRTWTLVGLQNATRAERFAISPDGLLAANVSTAGGYAILDETLQSIGTGPPWAGPSGSFGTRNGAAFTRGGDIWMINGADVFLSERRYSSSDNPVVRTSLPQPEVLKVAQRPASTLLDIDFRVEDSDSATVEVAALGFVNGGDTLADILKLSTLVEGTATNVGEGQATNVTKRLTWNAAADWSSSFGEIQVEVLAKDQRDLLGLHFITVPVNGVNPAFQASAKPVENEDLLSLWYWLIAKGDSAIALVSGEVKGVGGSYDGQTLAREADFFPLKC